MEFTTKINSEDIDIYSHTDLADFLWLHKDNDIDSIECTAIVRWNVEFEVREYGVKSIDITVSGIDIEGEAEYYEIDDVECEDKQFKEFSISSNDFEVINNMEITHNAIYPEKIEIDIKKKTITVE